MDNTQTTQVVNEFGKVVDQNVESTSTLNTQGKETTLEEVLAAVRGMSNSKTDKDQAAPAPTKDDSSDPVKDSKQEFNTGNKALDVAVSSFVRSTGATDADLQRATKAALEYGDAALLDRAFLTERFKDRAAEAIAIAEAVIEQSSIERQKTVDSVYAIAGGEESWKTALGVYKQHAPAGLQKALTMMFNSGDAASVKEAAQMVVEFAQGSGALVKPGSRQVASSGSADAQGLSAEEFKQARQKLNMSSRNYVADYNRLFELRRIGKSLGK